MAASKLSKKLFIKPGQRIAVINAPPEAMALLRPLPEGVSVTREFEQELEFMLLFVRNLSEIQKLAPRALKSIEHDAMFWISYPKQSSKLKSDITRDVGWNIVEAAGLEGVAQVAIDETWSASRFRPRELVGKGRRS